PVLWNNPEKAQSLGRERVQLDEVVSAIRLLETGLLDAAELFEMAVQENDNDSAEFVLQELDRLTKRIEQLEFQRMFSGEMDANSAYVDIQSGSGGTEAQ